MSCKCSPSLKRLMADFKALGHIDSGCCGDAAHQARVSDHNPDSSGYAHAQDVHEKNDHDMQPFVDYIMANPAKFPQVKYLIYERVIYYPTTKAGHKARGKYAYTGPNDHAHHLHVSIYSDATNYAGSWHVAEAYGSPTQEDDMTPDERLSLKNVEASVNHFQEIFNEWDAKIQAIGSGGGAVDVDALVKKVADELAERLKG